jgi:hypothetical protein
MFLRFGSTVLEPAEYRSRKRAALLEYAAFHGRQRLRPSRADDHDFRSYHREAVRRITDEHPADREVAAMAVSVRAMLRRRNA